VQDSSKEPPHSRGFFAFRPNGGVEAE